MLRLSEKMTHSTTISKLLLTSALSFGLNTTVMAEEKPSHPDLSATTGKAAIEKKTPGEASAQEVKNHRANPEEKISDAEITKKIKADLTAHKELESTNITVETNNGVATLTGTVPSDIEHKRAVTAAKSIKGVNKVNAAGLKVKPN